jgi:cytochrome P450
MSTTIELPTNGPTSFDEVLRGDKGAVGPLYERMRAANPFFSSRFDGWVFTRYEDVRAVLADERAFPPLTHGAGTTEVYGRNVLQLSGQAHADVVAPVARALRPNARLQGEIRDVVEEVAEQYALHLMRADGPVDLRREIFSPYPMAIIAALMGLPTGAQFRSDYGHVVRAATSNVDGDPDIRRAGEEARSRVF